MSVPASAGLSATWVDSYSDFMTLREEWDALDVGSVFLTHEWFDAAWQWRRRDVRAGLAIVCVRRDGRLDAVLPLLRSRDGGGRRTLEFLTVPDTQQCDLLVAKGNLDGVVDCIADALAARRSEWETLRLAYLTEDSVALRMLLPAIESRGLAAQCVEAGGNPFISLDGNWDTYYAGRSRSLKKAFNLAANRLAKAGDLGVEWLAAGNAECADAAAFVAAAIEISTRSWKRSTGNSLDHAGPQAFFRRMAELATKTGWLSIWLLKLDGRPVAMEWQLAFAGQIHALRSDYVEDCEELSPGTYLNKHLLEQLFGRGLRRYWMGPGDNPYKKRWTEQAIPLRRLDAYSPAWRGRIFKGWDRRVKPLLRRFRHAVAMKRKVEST